MKAIWLCLNVTDCYVIVFNICPGNIGKILAKWKGSGRVHIWKVK